MRAEHEQLADEQLVALRRDVLSDVEHAVGNLLQRMHHAARAASAAGAAQGERLQGTLDDLERLLELFFDYVSPVEVQVRPIAAGRIAESMASQLRAQGAGDIAPIAAPDLQVLVDSRVIGRSFLLLAQSCLGECDGSGRIVVETVHEPGGERVQFVVHAGGEAPAVPSAHSSLAAAVAGRLIELQGGELHTWPRPGCACAVVLPVAI